MTTAEAIEKISAQRETIATAKPGARLFGDRVELYSENVRARYIAEADALIAALVAGDERALRDAAGGPDSFRNGASYR